MYLRDIQIFSNSINISNLIETLCFGDHLEIQETLITPSAPNGP